MIIIIATVSAVAILSLGLLGDDRALEQEARRLRSLVQLAGDEALMQGREFGLEFMRSGYRFVEYDPFTNRWSELTGDELLRPRALEEGITFELFLEDRAVQLREQPMQLPDEDEDEDKDKDQRRDERSGVEKDDYAPHVLIMSSGDVTPFDVVIVRDTDDAEVLLATNDAGQLEIETDEDELAALR